MNEEAIKQAFLKVKQDIFELGKELSELKIEIYELKKLIEEIKEQEIIGKTIPTHQEIIPTHPTHNPAHLENPADDLPLYSLKRQNIQLSTGNEGVPTDRQTNQQTDRHIFQQINKQEKESKYSHLDKAAEILNSLDSLKKEVRLKFKQLTSQEMKVFSLLYQLDDQNQPVDYRLLSSKLSLSESSIRDYIAKIAKKGIPIIKEKPNNKQIILHISSELKKIASLNTILQLREL